jgi:signal peptidase I
MTDPEASSLGRSPRDPADEVAVPVPPTAATDARIPPVEPEPAPEEDDGTDGAGSLLRELPILVLVAFVLAFLLRTFVVQVFFIPSSSMEPTLQVDDRILVDKVTYRLRDLERGEVVVFEGDPIEQPDDRGTVERVVRGVGQLVGLAPANARDFVKRVVGLPGDEIFIDEEGTVFVNGDVLDEPYLGQPDPRSCGPLIVPAGKLFFLGDNRANSSDSRASLGFVPADHVVGRAFLVLWPPDRLHLLEEPDFTAIPGPPGTAPEVADAGAMADICMPR